MSSGHHSQHGGSPPPLPDEPPSWSFETLDEERDQTPPPWSFDVLDDEELPVPRPWSFAVLADQGEPTPSLGLALLDGDPTLPAPQLCGGVVATNASLSPRDQELPTQLRTKSVVASTPTMSTSAIDPRKNTTRGTILSKRRLNASKRKRAREEAQNDVEVLSKRGKLISQSAEDIARSRPGTFSNDTPQVQGGSWERLAFEAPVLAVNCQEVETTKSAHAEVYSCVELQPLSGALAGGEENNLPGTAAAFENDGAKQAMHRKDQETVLVAEAMRDLASRAVEFKVIQDEDATSDSLKPSETVSQESLWVAEAMADLANRAVVFKFLQNKDSSSGLCKAGEPDRYKGAVATAAEGSLRKRVLRRSGRIAASTSS